MTTTTTLTPTPTLGERVRIDRRWYRVASTNATVDGIPHHVLLAPLVSRQGEPALLALTLAELSALTTGSLGRTRQKQQGYAQSVRNPSPGLTTPRSPQTHCHPQTPPTAPLHDPATAQESANGAPSLPLYAPNAPRLAPEPAPGPDRACALALVLAFFAIVAFLTLAPGTALVVCAVGVMLWMGVRGATSTSSKPKGRRR